MLTTTHSRILNHCTRLNYTNNKNTHKMKENTHFFQPRKKWKYERELYQMWVLELAEKEDYEKFLDTNASAQNLPKKSVKHLDTQCECSEPVEKDYETFGYWRRVLRTCWERLWNIWIPKVTAQNLLRKRTLKYLDTQCDRSELAEKAEYKTCGHRHYTSLCQFNNQTTPIALPV